MSEWIQLFVLNVSATGAGIFLAFSLDRAVERNKHQNINQQITNSIIFELYENLELIPIIRNISPYIFTQFQTTAWDMWRDRIEFDDYELMFELSLVYHKLILFNEAKKHNVPSEAGGIFEQYPDFYNDLENGITLVLHYLEYSER